MVSIIEVNVSKKKAFVGSEVMLVWAPLYPAMAKFSLQTDQVPVEVRKMFGVHFVNDYSLKMHGHVCGEIFPF